MTSDKNEKHTFRKTVGYVFPFLLTGLFLYLAFKDVNLSEAFELISHISIPYFLVFLVVFSLSHYIRAVRWKIIIGSVKKDTHVFNLLGATMIGYGVNCVIPRLGEVYRGLFLAKWEGISRTSMLGTIIVERIIDILALGISVLISVTIYSGDLYKEVTWLSSALILGAAVILLLIIVLYLTVKFKEKFYNAIVRFIGKISENSAEKVAYIFHTLTDGFAALKTSKSYFYTFLLSVVIMVVYGLNSYIGFYMLNMNEIQDVTFEMAWVLMTISAFGIIIPTPGGTGSYHAITILVLTTLYGFGQEISAAFALLTHFISYIAFILSTVLFTYLVNKRQVKLGYNKENFFTVLKNSRES
ncbi:MAG: lysylphosphatidylglycerol synthase transmembrane domain-containing protein [Melioribacteraceae bacterium]|nr:flippase-like domain-containing protein [Melioribacteraceae bacterium]WKZ68645.1 MAG: lysylphosphatidylglycerol synthase transmembrane domain-containing protein [Melioribacteraceae bacterium]